MDIIGALRQEESKLQRQLTAVQGAIAALNGGNPVASRRNVSSPNGTHGKRTMSAAVRRGFLAQRRHAGRRSRRRRQRRRSRGGWTKSYSYLI